MMQRMQIAAMFGWLVLLTGGITIWSDGSHATAQTSTSKSKTKPSLGIGKSKTGETKDLDTRAEKNLENFLTESLRLADEYERAGKFEDAQDQLRSVNKLKPDIPGLKDKIEKLNESVFQTNEYEAVFDAADGWKAMIQVFKGKPVRIAASGQVKLNLAASSDPEGLPTKDPRTDMLAGIRCGALMGLVFPISESGTGAGAGNKGGRGEKSGEPFEIGKHKEITPSQDGILLVNLNLPSGHKSTGKLNLQFSGHWKPAPREVR